MLIAASRGIVILTDSDAAGFKIRSYLLGMLPKEQVANVYIPDVTGKEKRKRAPSAEGRLGVEGMDTETLQKAFELAGITASPAVRTEDPITITDLYEDGFTGGRNSKALRLALYKSLALPAKLNTNAAVPLLNSLLTRGEYKALAHKISSAT
ncbi:hypothetical protein FACS1894191_8430 [Clostridia bacterium]|nr:hypothetical protein FACS1894191_8430 [Clostridia bacterium]